MRKTYRITGLMSGTSLDGTDLAYCELTEANDKWNYTILHGQTIPYPEGLKKALEDAVFQSSSRIASLDLELGSFYGESINSFHGIHGISPDFIASHGHTVFHDPAKGLTLQIGNGKVMAKKTGITVVNNFRKEDVKFGGQGAPLVPVGDRLLFGEYDVCLNIGGIANLSFEENGIRRAYDICPANMILNYLSKRAGKDHDHDGMMARSGICNTELLRMMNGLGYYQLLYPKSLGKEWFEIEIRKLLDESGLPLTDLLATSVEHIAFQIGQSLKPFNHPTILATGGGVKNRWLMKRIMDISGNQITLPSDQLIDFKESLVFCLLAVLRIRNEINCYASVTGASKDLCTGEIHKPY